MKRQTEIILGDRKRFRRASSRWIRRASLPLIVIFMISYVFWSMGATDERTRFRQALVDISRIENASRLFRADNGRCPASVAELMEESRGTKYLGFERDPWGKPYKLICPAPLDEGGVFVTSGGPDGSFEGEDNITSL